MLSKFINLFKFACYHPLNNNGFLETIWHGISLQYVSKIIIDNILYFQKINKAIQLIPKKVFVS